MMCRADELVIPSGPAHLHRSRRPTHSLAVRRPVRPGPRGGDRGSALDQCLLESPRPLLPACTCVRMFGLAVGYHRYFAHRTFRTSRWGSFCSPFSHRRPRRKVHSGGPVTIATTIGTLILSLTCTHPRSAVSGGRTLDGYSVRSMTRQTSTSSRTSRSTLSCAGSTSIALLPPVASRCRTVALLQLGRTLLGFLFFD